MRDSERCGRRKTDPSTGSFQFEIQINIQRESPPFFPSPIPLTVTVIEKFLLAFMSSGRPCSWPAPAPLCSLLPFCLPPPSRGETEATRGSADARRSLKGSDRFLSERVRALRRRARCGRYHLGEALDAELLFYDGAIQNIFPVDFLWQFASKFLLRRP